MIRTYTELIQLPTFEERFKYLSVRSGVGQETFGFERYLNQSFYHSKEWRRVRRDVIVRDNGCDLADPEHEIQNEPIIIHHMNPVSIEDIVNCTEILLNPEYLISTRDLTHKAIHYGDESQLLVLLPERHPFDTCPWR